jgi:hypothetical protein
MPAIVKRETRVTSAVALLTVPVLAVIESSSTINMTLYTVA